MSESSKTLVRNIRRNIQLLITTLDDISQEFRRAVMVKMTSLPSKQNISYLRNLLETDNTLRDILADLKQKLAKLSSMDKPIIYFRQQQTIQSMYITLTSLFDIFDEINDFMSFDEKDVDDILMNIVNDLQQVSEEE